METPTKPVKLNRDTVRTLDEIRAGADNPLCGATPDAAEELFGRHIRPLLEGSGMSGLQVMHYGWFLRELARLWREKTGRDLAFHLELCIRKWLNLGLEANTVQFLVTEIHLRLKAAAAGGQNLTTETPRLRVSEPTPGPRPQTPDSTAKAAKSPAEPGLHPPIIQITQRGSGGESVKSAESADGSLGPEAEETAKNAKSPAEPGLHPPITQITQRGSGGESVKSAESADKTSGPACHPQITQITPIGSGEESADKNSGPEVHPQITQTGSGEESVKSAESADESLGPEAEETAKAAKNAKVSEAAIQNPKSKTGNPS